MSAYSKDSISHTTSQSAFEGNDEEIRKFKFFCDNARDGNIIIKRDGRILYVNKAQCAMMGYTEEEYLQLNALDIDENYDMKRFQELFDYAQHTPLPPFETQNRKKDGTLFPVEVSITVLPFGGELLLFGVARDISQRKMAEEELQQSKSQLEIILKNIADGITVQDNTGKIIYANQAAAIASGYASVEELLNAPLLEYVQKFDMTDENGQPFSPADLPGRRAMQGEENPQVIIKFVHKQTHEVRWAIIKSTAIFDAMHKPYLVINAVQDITRLKELEQRKDQFISMASHELKTPVTSLKVYTQLLLKRFTKEGIKEVVTYLSRMDTQIDKLTKLIQELLDVSKAQVGKLEYAEERVAIDTLVHETAETVQQGSTRHTLVLHGESRATVIGDAERLGQVLINLMDNAIKYSPHSHTVDITITQLQDVVRIGVRDYGIGIPQEHQEKLFERFYRVSNSKDRTFPGLGIGLYIAHEIVMRHRGTIWVESKEGEGSTFCVSLPLYKE